MWRKGITSDGSKMSVVGIETITDTAPTIPNNLLTRLGAKIEDET